MKLGDLKKIDSSLEILKGDLEFPIRGITDVSQMAKDHFVFVKNKKFMLEWLSQFKENVSTGLIIEKKFYESLTEDQVNDLKMKAIFLATVFDVNISMSLISKPFYEKKYSHKNDVVDGRQMGTAVVDSSSWIAQGVFIGEAVRVGANVKIHSGVTLMSGVHIGDGCEIYPNTVIYRDVVIGKNVRIHSNCSIGADGFGYNFSKGEHLKVWHTGSVIIEDHVEIGANSCVDSGTFSPTCIGAGTKLDNHVQVGHNCKLGRAVIVCGQSAIGGSTIIGDFVVIGGKTGITNGVTIGRGAQIAGNAGVIGNIAEGQVVGGFPARDMKEWMKGVAFIRKHSLGKSIES